MTDGQQTYVPDIKAPSDIAKELASEGVDIFSIGIGEEIDRVELESFISKPEHIFLASDLKLVKVANHPWQSWARDQRGFEKLLKFPCRVED